MSHKITIICDNCQTEYEMSNDMELPPYWILAPTSIANRDGIINSREHFIHACSLDCLSEYATSSLMKEKMMLVDKIDNELYMDENEDDEETGEVEE